MVGNVTPQVSKLRLALEAFDEFERWITQKEARQDLLDLCIRQEKAAEAAGVGRDLNDARNRAKQILEEAQEKAREIEAEIDRSAAQAEEILHKAKTYKVQIDRDAAELAQTKAAYHRSVEQESTLLQKRKLELDEEKRKLIVRENQLKLEEEKVKGWVDRIAEATRPR